MIIFKLLIIGSVPAYAMWTFSALSAKCSLSKLAKNQEEIKTFPLFYSE